MSNLSELSKEEIVYVCKQIPTPIVKNYFQSYPKPFQEIKAGFRPDSLSAEDTVSLLVKNRNKKFISSFLNQVVGKWLDEIEQNINHLVEEGSTYEKALIWTLPESVFHENVKLYFMLAEKKVEEGYVRLLSEAMELRKESGNNKRIDETIHNENETEYEDTIQDLKNRIAASQEKTEALESELSQIKNEYDGQKKLFEQEASLIEKQKSDIATLQTELDHYRHLESYSDNPISQDIAKRFQHVSLGQVFTDYNGQTRIKRLADIVHDELIPFVQDDSLPAYFNNRGRLFHRNGPAEENSLGVWCWSAKPNESDPEKDFVTSDYSKETRVTEIVEFPQCRNLRDVVDVLVKGFEKNFISEKVLFGYLGTDGKWEGVLCNDNDFDFQGLKVRLHASVFTLRHYSISTADTISLADMLFYRKMYLGAPTSIFRVQSPYDVVKRILLNRLTVSALRENDLTQREAQRCKHFFEGIPTQTLVQEISDAYSCSESEANEYLNGFVSLANTYLSKEDVDSYMLSLAVSRNSELAERCKQQLADEWKSENEEKIEANKRAQEELNNIKSEKDKLNSTLTEIQQEISKNEKLAKDVEMETAERIKEARDNIARFISQMAFVSPSLDTPLLPEKTPSDCREFVSHNHFSIVDSGEIDDVDTFEEELASNLITVGYSEEAAYEMAQVLCFGLCNKIPIVIGNNAEMVAQCAASTLGMDAVAEVFVDCHSTNPGRLAAMFEAKGESNPLVYLFHGVFEGYGNNLFNVISNCLHMKEANALVLISIQGMSSSMLFEGIWNEAFFIDGDIGFEGFTNRSLNGFKPIIQFVKSMEQSDYKAQKKSLQRFKPVLSNIQICWYARYLATFGVDLNDCKTIVNQLIAVGRSAGRQDELRSLFHENGITYGEKVLEETI